MGISKDSSFAWLKLLLKEKRKKGRKIFPHDNSLAYNEDNLLLVLGKIKWLIIHENKGYLTGRLSPP